MGAGIAAVLFGILLLRLIKFINRARADESFGLAFSSDKLSPEQVAILEQHFQFYTFLPAQSKEIFRARVARFIKLKKFVPRQMDEVSEEMKVLIAAAAIQLTFGFPRVFLTYFQNIIVFPDQFFNSTSQRYHKGEVNPKMKAIVISWKHFAEGYANAEGVNLGLHEMAHALQLENIVRNHEFDFLDDATAEYFIKQASIEIEQIRAGDTSFFRVYGGTDHQEFFAVAVENFFERPAAFMAHRPELYKTLANLLHQDPLRLYPSLEK